MKLTDEKILELAVTSDLAYESKFGGHYSPFAEGTNLQHFILDFARSILKKAGVGELERDAERYRWLCRQGYGCDPEPFRLLDDFDSDKQSIDAAIDEAMKAK